MKTIRLVIVDIGRRGEGVARHEGRTVFVPYGLPGETVQAEIDDDRGRLVTVEHPAVDRVEPFCRHFGRCGGCLLQHWRDEAYRGWKRNLVVTALTDRGIETTVDPLVDAHGAGRRRVSLHVRRRGTDVIAGYMELRSHRLHDIDICPILVPPLAGACDLARRIGVVLGDCDFAVTVSDAGLDVAVKAARQAADAFAASLVPLAAEFHLARLTFNGEPLVTWRRPAVSMGRAEVALPPVSFLQATAAGEERLAQLVIEGVGKAKSVADLFCGLGPFALRLAERSQVTGFDSDRPAIASLAAAAKATAGIKPLAAMLRDLFREPLVPGELAAFDAVVFDPPRAGAEAQARQLAKSKVATIVAVSCDPVTLARDAEILVRGGYDLARVTPVDQFKYSHHVETVAVFRRRARQ